MLKYFYRLKRRRGVVLFAVISIMTLLIAAAATAYFTARSSYQTVVSNYDSSQLYLSATSVSDMIIEAITQDTSHEKDASGKYINYYTKVKQEIKKLKDTGSDGSTVTLWSKNLKDVSGRSTASLKTLMDAASADPLEPGVIDGVKTVIKRETHKDNTPAAGQTTYYFSVTTTGFYRNNAVTVMDNMYNVAGAASSNPPAFDTFFTSTAQSGGGHSPDRAVVIDTDLISDNAYFQTDVTCFTQMGGRDDYFLGGLRTSGTLMCTYHTRTQGVQDPSGNMRHDWIIGGDFVLMNKGDNPLINIGQNNIYVGGDLIINYDGSDKLQAKNIYVMGNIYVINGGITGNVFCEGTVYQGSNGGNKFIKDDFTDLYTKLTTYQNKVNNIMSSSGAGSYDLNLNNLKISGSDSITASSFNSSTTKVKQSYKEPDGNTFNYKLSEEMPISDLLDTSGNLKNQTYGSFTVKPECLANEVTIDISDAALTPVKNAANQTIGLEGDFGGIKVYVKTNTTLGNAESISIDIPYKENGYSLLIKNEATRDSSFIIHTADNGKTMPILLRSNFDDGSGKKKDSNGYNAFSWKGSQYNNNGCSNSVILTSETGYGTAKGNVLFEMGNYEENGGYKAYDPASGLTTATYYAKQKDFVGTYDEFTKLGGSLSNVDGAAGFYKVSSNANYQNGTSLVDSNSKPVTNCEPRIMLVSNLDGGVAVNGPRNDNLLCGYIYAPNATYYGGAQAATPVVGGMIVSDYILDKCKMIYAEPDPDIIKEILNASNPVGGAPPAGSTEGTWYTAFDKPSNLGKNFIG